MDATQFTCKTRHGLQFYTNRSKGGRVLETMVSTCPPDHVVIAVARTPEDTQREQVSASTRSPRPPPKRSHGWYEYAHATPEQVQNLIASDKHLYEVMHPDRRQKVAFDIDLKGGSQNTLTEITTLVRELLPGANLHICGSVVPKKTSYHIVVSNYYATCVEDLAPIKAFCVANAALGFDPAVYKPRGLFKFINQSKADGRIQAFMSGSTDLLKHTVMHDFDPEATDITTLGLDQLSPKQPGQKRRRTERVPTDHEFPNLQWDPPATLDIYDAHPLDLLQHLPCPPRDPGPYVPRTVCLKVARWCVQVKIPWESFWAWNLQKDASAERQERYKQFWDQIDLTKYPVSEHLVRTYLVGYAYNNNVLKAEPTRRMIESYNTQFNHKSPNQFLQASDHKVGADHKVIAIHSGLGSAKSWSTMQYMAEYIQEHPQARILWVTCRIALTNDQRGRLEHMTGCQTWQYYLDLTRQEKESYKDAGKQAIPPQSPQYFVCSVSSLVYATGTYDLVVLDESETVFATFGGEAKIHRKFVDVHWNRLKKLVQNCTKVIVMDGFMTRLTLDVLNGWRLPKPWILGTEQPATQRHMEIADSVAYIIHMVKECLARGEKVFIATGPKGKSSVDCIASVENLVSTFIKTFDGHVDQDSVRGSHIIGYHGDTYAEKARLKGDVNELWGDPKVRVVIGNAALAVGVNFDPPQADIVSGRLQAFDRVVGLYDPGTIAMRDFFQLLFRVRHPKNKTFVVHIGKPHGTGSIRNPGRQLPEDTVWMQLQKNIDLEARASHSKRHHQVFRKFCEWMNISLDSKAKLHLSKDERELICKQMDCSHNMFAWANIPTLTDSQYELLAEQDAMDLGPGSLLAMEKARFSMLLSCPQEQQAEYWDSDRWLVLALHDLGTIDRGGPKWALNKIPQAAFIVQRFYRSNGLSYDSEIPETATCETPFDEIQQAFHMRKKPTDYRMDLYAKLLNIYFKRAILYKDWDKRNKRTQAKYTWTTRAADLDLMREIMSDLVVFSKHALT